MIAISIVFSVLLLAGYLAWGIYTLRLRFVKHEEIPFPVEVATIVAVLIFYAIEFWIQRTQATGNVLLFIGAGLALIVSGAALYGHMVVSVVARVFVDAIHPVDQERINEPQYGPAEALERMGDYDGAVSEYRVIARIFPKEPEPLLRAAECWLELRQPEDAAGAFERAVRLTTDPERAQFVTNRLADLYMSELDDTAKAEQVLTNYLERFPDTDFSVGVERRLERLRRPAKAAPQTVVSDSLELPGESSE